VKKLIFVLPIFVALLLAVPAVAKNGGTGAQNQAQNQVQTANEGEEQNVQVQAQEQENFGEGDGLQQRSQNALQNMSEVAIQVQEMLKVRTEGGIGEQVREIAKAQNQAQNQIQEHLNKLDKKNKFWKFIFGPNYQALGDLSQQLEQNQLRIQTLQTLQNQLTNQADQTMIQEAIEAMIQQNTALQEMVNAQNQAGSLLGWLVKLFNR